jgi:uncharacterized protein
VETPLVVVACMSDLQGRRFPMKLKGSKYNLFCKVDDGLWIYNTLTGSLWLKKGDPVNSQFQFSDVPGGLSEPLLSTLRTNGLIVDEEVDETAFVQESVEVAKRSSRSMSVTIAPTLGCNFGCFYCFERKTSAWQEKKIMADDLTRVVQHFIFARLYGKSSLAIRWFGGEPLLASEKIRMISRDLLQVCDDAGIEFQSQIQTNGFLLDEEKLQLLRECRINTIHCTLDGDQENHNKTRHETPGQNTFDTIIRNLKVASSNGFSVIIRINVTSQNSNGIFGLIDTLAENFLVPGAQIYFYPVYSHYNGDLKHRSAAVVGFSNVKAFASLEVDYYKYLLVRGYKLGLGFLEPKALPCSALKDDDYMIDFDGRMLKCDHEFGSEESALGNIRTGITNTKRADHWSSINPRDNPLCPTCPILPTCLGHCASMRQHVTPEEACPSKKHNYAELLELCLRQSIWRTRAPVAAFADYELYHKSLRSADPVASGSERTTLAEACIV